jgi:hypothetical protein
MRPGTSWLQAEREYKDARQDFKLDASLRHAIARDDAAQRFFFAPEVRYER